jgi:hypothetical protein
MARFRVAVSLVLLACSYAFAQDPPKSDPYALELAAKSIAVQTGGNPITDVTLGGEAAWIAGSDKEAGAAILMAKGTGESRVELDLDGGTRIDVRNDLGKYPAGASQVKDGDRQTWPMHNCWINASWFFPALSFLNATADPSLIFFYIGAEDRNGEKVEHLQVYRYLAGQKPATIALTQQVSTTDFYLDSASLLPVAITFNTHADNDALTDIGLEIDFSKYQSVEGIQVPFHIQKLVWGGLAVDVTVESVAMNSGLSDELFSIQ